MRESVDAKAARYLAEGRVKILTVGSQRVQAFVRVARRSRT